MTQEELEKRVMEKLLDDNYADLTALRFRYEHATVSKQEVSGDGFTVHFAVSVEALPTQLPEFELADVLVYLADDPQPSLATFDVKNGFLDNPTCHRRNWPSRDVSFPYSQVPHC